MKKNLIVNININKTTITIIALNIIHIFLLAGIFAYTSFTRISPEVNTGNGFIIMYSLIFIVLIVNSYITIRNAISLSHTFSQYKMLKDTLNQIEELNKTLRAQRHDFMNHLQVVYGLMEMEEYKDAMGYIHNVYNDIQKVNKVLKTSNTAINALIQAKTLQCEKNSITLFLKVTSRLENLKVPSWEMCRVVGNIIDNAIYALEENNPPKKIIWLTISEDLKYFIFSIKNSGSSISPQLLEKIFEPGFTTKGSKGEGMGLFIAKNIMDEYGGNITLQNDNTTTCFIITVPK